jgi:hypothetical protein
MHTQQRTVSDVTDQQWHLGLGRIAASEIEVPNTLGDMVWGGYAVVQRGSAAAPRHDLARRHDLLGLGRRPPGAAPDLSASAAQLSRVIPGFLSYSVAVPRSPPSQHSSTVVELESLQFRSQGLQSLLVNTVHRVSDNTRQYRCISLHCH